MIEVAPDKSSSGIPDRKERRHMETEVFVWLGLLVLFIAVEVATVGLTSIWFAGGSLAALVISLTGARLVWQIAGFFIVSFFLLAFTRPFALKYINFRHEKTNCEELIGSTVKVTETVDNYAQTGTAVAKGLEWTARAEDDGEKIEAGSMAEVVGISGVKLILKHHEEGNI